MTDVAQISIEAAAIIQRAHEPNYVTWRVIVSVSHPKYPNRIAGIAYYTTAVTSQEAVSYVARHLGHEPGSASSIVRMDAEQCAIPRRAPPIRCGQVVSAG